MNCWKAKQNYGIVLKEISLSNIIYHGGYALDTVPKRAKFARFYRMEKDISLEHPILLLNDLYVYSAGNRILLAIERGYDSIDAVVSNDKEVLKSLYDVQRSWAKSYFSIEEQEQCETLAPPFDVAMKKALDLIKNSSDITLKKL